MYCCQWNVSSAAHTFVQYVEKLLCNIRISLLCMCLIMMKWEGRVMKLWWAYHLLSIILYCIYWHGTVICVLCIDCVVVLTFASSSLCTYFAICRWLYSLHFMCWYFTLLYSLVFLVALTSCMCFISFIVSYSLIGYPVAVISTATNK
jgi:hypothetical protein